MYKRQVEDSIDKDGKKVLGFNSRLNALIELREHESAMQNLHGVLDAMDPYKTSSGSVSKADKSTQTLFDYAKALITPPVVKGQTKAETQKAAIDRAHKDYADALADLATRAGSNPLDTILVVSPHVELNETMASMIGALVDKSAQDVNALASALSQIATDGRFKRVREIIKEKAHIEATKRHVLGLSLIHI